MNSSSKKKTGKELSGFLTLEQSNSSTDLLIFLEFYFIVAKENIESVFKDISTVKHCLNFWLNFALNFKDETFVALIKMKVGDRSEFIWKKIKEILKFITSFLEDNLKSRESYAKIIEPSLFDMLEMLLRFFELFDNISNSEISNLIDEPTRLTVVQCLENFSSFSKIDLIKLKEVYYEKVGYSFLDFKGNFIWADKYTEDVLFEQANIEKGNLFDLMTDYSKFIIRNKYHEKFFDFLDDDCKIRVFTFSINIKMDDNLFDTSADTCFSKLFNNLNNNKTLVSRASVVLLQNYDDNKSNACILLETKLSPFRQNFDYFHWRCYLN